MAGQWHTLELIYPFGHLLLKLDFGKGNQKGVHTMCFEVGHSLNNLWMIGVSGGHCSEGTEGFYYLATADREVV